MKGVLENGQPSTGLTVNERYIFMSDSAFQTDDLLFHEMAHEFGHLFSLPDIKTADDIKGGLNKETEPDVMLMGKPTRIEKPGTKLTDDGVKKARQKAETIQKGQTKK